MSVENLVTVEHISRHFGGHCALSDVSFNVQRGEVLGFLGPNGAGKTTTMQIICGVLAASDGRVAIAGHDIVEEPKQAKRHIGFLPERPPLYLNQTVDEYLNYCAQLRHMPKNRINGAVAESKARCGLETAGKRLIANLSKGYQQRVGIAQAIIHQPALVILDEPTSGLDPNQIVEIRTLISELGEDHSVILSTHILPEVQASCDRVLIINEGALVLDEAIHALANDNQQQILSVALHNPPLPEELEAIAGVIRVDCLDKHHFRICHGLDHNTVMLLSERAAAAGWGIYELVPERDSLEQIFIQLTSGDINKAQ